MTDTGYAVLTGWFDVGMYEFLSSFSGEKMILTTS